MIESREIEKEKENLDFNNIHETDSYFVRSQFYNEQNALNILLQWSLCIHFILILSVKCEFM